MKSKHAAIIAAIITGVCTLAVGFFGGSTINNNITVMAEGQSIKLNDKDVEQILSNSEEMKNNVESLKKEVQEKQSEIEKLQSEVQGKESDIENLKADVIKDISLVVNSVAVKGKYIGVAENGELLLSTTALSDYFGEPATWDANHKIVYIGDKSEKIAKEISLWDKPYKDIQYLQDLKNDIEKQRIGLTFNDTPYQKENDLIIKENFLTYSLNGKAQSISGAFVLDTNESNLQMQFFVYDQNGTELYVSPKLNEAAPLSPFIINTEGVLEVKILAQRKSTYVGANGKAYIENLTALTTDY